MSDEQKESEKETVQQHFVYCGPNLPAGYSLKQYQAFTGGLPNSISKLTEECKPLGSLFVVPDKVAATRIALTQKGSVEANMFKAVQDYFKKGKE